MNSLSKTFENYLTSSAESDRLRDERITAHGKKINEFEITKKSVVLASSAVATLLIGAIGGIWKLATSFLT